MINIPYLVVGTVWLGFSLWGIIYQVGDPILRAIGLGMGIWPLTAGVLWPAMKRRMGPSLPADTAERWRIYPGALVTLFMLVFAGSGEAGWKDLQLQIANYLALAMSLYVLWNLVAFWFYVGKAALSVARLILRVCFPRLRFGVRTAPLLPSGSQVTIDVLPSLPPLRYRAALPSSAESASTPSGSTSTR